MYPYDIIPGISLYDILFTAALILALVVFRIYSDKRGIETKLFNLCLYAGLVGICVGYVMSILTQAVYNYNETGVFEINSSTGMTFYGGLLGGAGIFLVIYFIYGAIRFKDKIHIKRFWEFADIAGCSIAVAHATGRIGCLMVGCCYGRKTSSWLSVMNVHLGYKTVPVQLYESLFLYALFAVMSVRVYRGKKYNFPLYLMAYGVFRFIIEYYRGDTVERGKTVVDFLTPAQLTAIILFLVGAVMMAVLMTIQHKKKSAISAGEAGSCITSDKDQNGSANVSNND